MGAQEDLLKTLRGYHSSLLTHTLAGEKSVVKGNADATENQFRTWAPTTPVLIFGVQYSVNQQTDNFDLTAEDWSSEGLKAQSTVEISKNPVNNVRLQNPGRLFAVSLTSSGFKSFQNTTDGVGLSHTGRLDHAFGYVPFNVFIIDGKFFGGVTLDGKKETMNVNVFTHTETIHGVVIEINFTFQYVEMNRILDKYLI